MMGSEIRPIEMTEAATTPVVAASIALAGVRKEAQGGQRTTLDVLNAQSALYSAQRDHARARYDYLLAILRLKAAAGTLGGDDLALGAGGLPADQARHRERQPLQLRLHHVRGGGLEESACFDVKSIGKPCAGKSHARFDEGGLAK